MRMTGAERVKVALLAVKLITLVGVSPVRTSVALLAVTVWPPLPVILRFPDM